MIPNHWRSMKTGTKNMKTILAMIVVTFWVIFGLIVLRLCAWADTGMRGNVPIERSVIP